MHYRDVPQTHRSAKRFKRLALWAAILLCLIMLLGRNKWYPAGVPANPESVEMMKEYVCGAGADLETLILSDHHGTCGRFSYIDKDGKLTAPMGFVAILGQGVALSLSTHEWNRSRCAGPRSAP